MTDPTSNPYEPPKTDVNQPSIAQPTGSANYFVIGPFWLVVLSPLTMGMFEVYWSYRQWQAHKRRGEDINPVGRALFLIFFIHALFRKIRFDRIHLGLAEGHAQSGMATLFVVLAIVSNLAGRSSAGIATLVSLLVTVGSSFILSLAQEDINELAEKNGATMNRGIGAGGIILIVLSTSLFAFTLVAILTPS